MEKLPENRILMIDDDLKLCRLVKDYLAPFGFGVEAAHDGLSGLERIKNAEFGVVILDVMLPQMDGFEVLTHLTR